MGESYDPCFLGVSVAGDGIDIGIGRVGELKGERGQICHTVYSEEYKTILRVRRKRLSHVMCACSRRRDDRTSRSVAVRTAAAPVRCYAMPCKYAARASMMIATQRHGFGVVAVENVLMYLCVCT